MFLSEFLSKISARPLKCDPTIFFEDDDLTLYDISQVYLAGDTKQRVLIRTSGSKVRELREELEEVKTERHDIQDEYEKLKQDSISLKEYEILEKEIKSLKEYSDRIGTAVEYFADSSNLRLVADDATNLDNLREKYLAQQRYIETLEDNLSLAQSQIEQLLEK